MGSDTIYHITPIIAFRNEINQPWVVSVFPGRSTVGNTKQEADQELAIFSFIDLKDKGKYKVTQSGRHKGELELELYKYNLQDKDFWEKCFLWQRDTVGANGLYPFQEHNFSGLSPESKKYRKCNRCARDLKYPKINYPKEILDMYEESQEKQSK